MAIERMQLSRWQREVVACMTQVSDLNSVLLSGGRGGGKSYLLVYIILRQMIENGDGHRGVLIRTDLAGLEKLESMLLDYVPMYLPGSRYFKAKRSWECSNGARLRLIHQSDATSFNKLQGEDLSHIYIDELTQFPDPQTVLRIRSSMRTTDKRVRPLFVATANPFPHGWWCRDYIVTKAQPGNIFNCELFGGVPTVWFKSTLRDNPHLANPDQYEADLKASAFGDESRARAEIFGDWAGSSAGFFGTALSESRNMLPGDLVLPYQGVDGPLVTREHQLKWCWLGCDWGTASPAAAVLMVQVVDDFIELGGKHIVRGSWICVNETYVCGVQKDGSKEWNRGDRTLTTKKFAARVGGLLAHYGMNFGDIGRRRTIMDSAVTAQLGYVQDGWDAPVTLANQFDEYGFQVTGSPKSSRAVGWQFFKQLLHGADRGEPGLYISEDCESLWKTLPYCISDPKNPEDMEKGAPDHSADGVRYVLTAANQRQHGYRQPKQAQMFSLY